jgi:hypothetical protein
VTLSFEEIARKLDAVFEHEGSRGRILVGFYLERDEIAALRPRLERDDPPTGAKGRYGRVSVYESSDFVKEEPGAEGGTLGGIRFKFVQLDDWTGKV